MRFRNDRRHILGILVLAGLLASLGGCRSASGSPRPGEELVEAVVYTTLRPAELDIYLFEEPGGSPTRLTSHAALDYNAVFSPDGAWIVFTSERNGNADLYALELASGDLIPLTRHQAMDDAASFSPDGTRLVFVSTRDGDADVFAMPFDPGGSAEERAVNLTRRPGGDFNPAFSPDGRSVAYSRQDELWTTGNLAEGSLGSAATDVYVMGDDGSNPRRVSEPGDISGSPAWSRDGASLYYSKVGRPGAQVRQVSLDGSGDRVVAFLGMSPAVRADGRIGYSLPQPRPGMGPLEILRTGVVFSVAPDGTDLRLESDRTGHYFAPDFDRRSGRLVAHGLPLAEDSGAGRRVTFAPPGARRRVELPDRSLEVRGIGGYFPAILPSGEVLSTPLDRNEPTVPLQVSTVDGAAMRDLFVPDEGIAWGAAVASDAGAIVLAVGPPFDRGESNVDIWKVGFDGSEAANLTADVMENDALPHVSADGRTIVFRSGGDGSGSVFRMNAEGGERRLLTASTAIETMPAISPDGEWVVFPTDEVPGRKLWIQRLDGSDGRFLEPDRLMVPDVSMHPRFSADGLWVVFTSNRGGANDEASLTWFPQAYGDLWAVPVAGGEAVRLTQDKWEDGPCDWAYVRLPARPRDSR